MFDSSEFGVWLPWFLAGWFGLLWLLSVVGDAVGRWRR